MLDLKINIREKNIKKYTDIAFLVDKPKFLIEINRLRNKWRINKLLELNEVYDWKKNIYDTDTERLLKIEDDITLLLYKFRRHKGFTKVAESALLTGIVSESLYKYTFLEYHICTENYRHTPELYMPAIFISYQSTKKDVLDEFKLYQDRYGKKTYDFIDFSKSFTFYKRKSSNLIKRHRDIYWMYLNEKSLGKGVYGRLSNKLQDMKEYKNYNDETILRKLVNRYIKALQV